MGPVLGLGSEGDLRLHHLGDLRDLPARPRDLWLEGEARGGHHRVRLRRDPLHPLRGEPLDRRAALVRPRLNKSAARRSLPIASFESPPQRACPRALTSRTRSPPDDGRAWPSTGVRGVRRQPVRRTREGMVTPQTLNHQRAAKRTKNTSRLTAASPPRLLQHFLMLMLPHLLAALLDYRTHLARTIAVRDG